MVQRRQPRTAAGVQISVDVIFDHAQVVGLAQLHDALGDRRRQATAGGVVVMAADEQGSGTKLTQH